MLEKILKPYLLKIIRAEVARLVGPDLKQLNSELQALNERDRISWKVHEQNLAHHFSELNRTLLRACEGELDPAQRADLLNLKLVPDPES